MVASIAHLSKVYPSWVSLDDSGKISSIADHREMYTTRQTMEVVDSINQQALQGPLQGLNSLTAVFQKLQAVEVDAGCA